MTYEIEFSGPSYAPDAGGQCGKKAVAVCVECRNYLCAKHVVEYNNLPYCEGCAPSVKED